MITRIRISIIALTLCNIYSCSNSSNNKQETKDSLGQDTVNKKEKIQVEDDSHLTPTLEELINEYKERCDNTVIIDTFLLISGDTFRVRAKYYCVTTERTIMPKNILEMFKLDSFVTHPFETQVQVWKNNDKGVDTIIRRNFFNKIMPDDYLRAYGDLFPPNLQVKNNAVSLGYSISVPLTDIGISADLILIENNEIKLSASSN